MAEERGFWICFLFNFIIFPFFFFFLPKPIYYLFLLSFFLPSVEISVVTNSTCVRKQRSKFHPHFLLP